MKFKKIGENEHGQIVNVFTDQGFQIGSIEKWHDLFVATDWIGEKFTACSTRAIAASRLEEHFLLATSIAGDFFCTAAKSGP